MTNLPTFEEINWSLKPRKCEVDAICTPFGITTMYGFPYWNNAEGCEYFACHRSDGPAQLSHRTREWSLFGKPHRKDGPTFEVCNGIDWEASKNKLSPIEEWYLNGKRHRDDGPAIIDRSSNIFATIYQFWLNDEKVAPSEIFTDNRTVMYWNRLLHHLSIQPGETGVATYRPGKGIASDVYKWPLEVPRPHRSLFNKITDWL